MSYVAEYERINWENYSSTRTPLDANNLNKIDFTVKKHDEECLVLDLTKLEKSEALTMLADVTYNSSTGVFTFTRKNGTQIVADINIEKIPVSFSMDANGVITMTTTDGNTYTADVGSLIKKYEFVDSDTIDLEETYDSKTKKTKVKADIIDGSVTENKLQPNFLADCRNAKDSAEIASSNSNTNSLIAEGYSVGEQNGEPVEEGSPYYQNNAKYYAEQAGTKTARTIAYDGTASGISANNVQGAIDETVTKVNSKADVSALDAKADKTQLSNRNLLDNAWFVNPINQRGQNSYSGAGYGIDRWKAQTSDSVVTIMSNGCKFSRASDAYIQLVTANELKNLSNKTVTVSIMLADGTIYQGSRNIGEIGSTNGAKAIVDDPRFVYQIAWFPSEGSYQIARLTIKEEVTIKAIKLEIGAISTLANDTVPNYAEELMKCKRRYQRVLYGQQNYCGLVLGNSSDTGYGTINLQVPMAKRPTLVFGGDVKWFDGGNVANITSITINTFNDNQITILANGSGFVRSNAGVLFANNASAFIELSADL